MSERERERERARVRERLIETFSAKIKIFNFSAAFEQKNVSVF